MIQIKRRVRDRESLARTEAARICLIKPSALGDVVQALPVLTALRVRFPRAHIAWVVNSSYAKLLAGHPCLDEIIAFERGPAGPSSAATWRAFRDLCGSLRQRRFDLVCDIQGLFRSGLMTWATRAPRRVGLADAREGSQWFYTDIVPIVDGQMSAVDRYWSVAQALGVGESARQFQIHIDVSDQDWAERQVPVSIAPCVAIHVGARWMTKRWPTEHFSEIARRLDREFAANLVLVGGPEDCDAAERIAGVVSGCCVNLVGKTSLKQLAAVLRRVHLLLSNDSGPMHLAAALGTPVAALFTCTSTQRARPYGNGHVLFTTNVWCAASYLKKCSRLECMAELTPDRVWPVLSARVEAIRVQLAA